MQLDNKERDLQIRLNTIRKIIFMNEELKRIFMCYSPAEQDILCNHIITAFSAAFNVAVIINDETYEATLNSITFLKNGVYIKFLEHFINHFNRCKFSIKANRTPEMFALYEKQILLAKPLLDKA